MWIHKGVLRQFYDVCELYKFLLKDIAQRERAERAGREPKDILCPIRQPISDIDMAKVVRHAKRNNLCGEATASFVEASTRGNQLRNAQYFASMRDLQNENDDEAILRNSAHHQVFRHEPRTFASSVSRAYSTRASVRASRAPRAVPTASDVFWSEQNTILQHQQEASSRRGEAASRRVSDANRLNPNHFVPTSVIPRSPVSRAVSRTTNSGMSRRLTTAPAAPVRYLVEPSEADAANEHTDDARILIQLAQEDIRDLQLARDDFARHIASTNHGVNPYYTKALTNVTNMINVLRGRMTSGRSEIARRRAFNVAADDRFVGRQTRRAASRAAMSRFIQFVLLAKNERTMQR